MTEQFDGVIVAGAGPVGLVTALKIARAGIVDVSTREADLETVFLNLTRAANG